MREHAPRVPTVAAFRWERAQWLRVSPGRAGAAAFLLLPALFCVPWGGVGWFESWRQGSFAVASLGAVALALATGRDLALPNAGEFWMFQKGIRPADWALNRWVATAVLGGGTALVWSLAWAVAAGWFEGGLDGGAAGSLVIWLLLLHLLVTAMLFAVGAAGTTRGPELVFVALLAAALAPLLLRALPSGAALVAAVLLPPLRAAAETRAAVAGGEPLRTLLPPLLHVLAYVTAMLALGTGLLSRRRPRG